MVRFTDASSLPGARVSTTSSPTQPQQPDTAHLGRVVFISAAAAMGGFLFGYDSAVINGAVTGIQKHFHVGNSETAFVVAIALLGSAAGAVAAGWLADHLGRVRTMLLAAVLFAISGVGSMFPPSVQLLGMWRVLGGVAIGIASVVAPTYIAEVAPTAYRGRLASFQQMAIVLGITVSQLANYALNRAAGGESTNKLGPVQAWQWMLGVEAVRRWSTG